ncbi:hypothetical protein HMPREF9104_00233, partial [Lentilactobacillus kisonensis F0435]
NFGKDIWMIGIAISLLMLSQAAIGFANAFRIIKKANRKD